MVIDQGTLLDRIDYNVESVAENVKDAVQELQTVSLASCAPSPPLGGGPAAVGKVQILHLPPPGLDCADDPADRHQGLVPPLQLNFKVTLFHCGWK